MCQSALDSGSPESLGAVAGFGGLFPLGDLAVLIDLFKAGKDRLVAQNKELVAAKVVRAAFHVADAEAAEKSLQKWNVAKIELVLQRLGAGGDDDALAGAQGRQQVGEGLAGAGARLDDEVAMLGESALDGLGHFKLAGAVFVGQRGPRKDAAGREELVEGGQAG